MNSTESLPMIVAALAILVALVAMAIAIALYRQRKTDEIQLIAQAAQIAALTAVMNEFHPNEMARAMKAHSALAQNG